MRRHGPEGDGRRAARVHRRALRPGREPHRQGLGLGTDETRTRLIAAAESLFAARGIDGPSLREITRAAGQRNTAALQYHFGDRDALVAAILAKHELGIAGVRDRLLDELDQVAQPDLRDLAGALVLPLVAKLEDPDGGRDFLQVVGEITARPGGARRLGIDGTGDAAVGAAVGASLIRWGQAVEPLLPPEAVGRPLHRRFAAIRFTNTELATRARDPARRDHRLFTNHLLDLVAALLGAPVSEPTARLIR